MRTVPSCLAFVKNIIRADWEMTNKFNILLKRMKCHSRRRHCHGLEIKCFILPENRPKICCKSMVNVQHLIWHFVHGIDIDTIHVRSMHHSGLDRCFSSAAEHLDRLRTMPHTSSAYL